MSSREAELLAMAVPASSLTAAGLYTSPRSWGVYELESVARGTKRFRYGNHPVRQAELEREFGRVTRIHLFAARSLAAELAGILNAGNQ